MKEEAYCPSKTFDGVRFALFGFDALTEHKVRSKLVNGGGVDAGGYTQNCTHVIVDKLAYDDPVCVAARDDGTISVTALWVDHSFDLGIVVDPSSIMYRPPKDLDGIPGAKNLIMCLTGYQRQDRDDIMTMVGLMGAQFSKPLVANKVTHLICYKFEGEKYELAKKMKRIKLVNHRWLEDCLREWEILPEANYNRSGYELEMLEAEAKDSEDEAERSALKQSERQTPSRSPYNTKVGNIHSSELSNIPADSMASKEKPNTVSTSLRQETGSNQETGSHCGVGTLGGATSEDLANQHNRTPISTKFETDLASSSRTVRKSPRTDALSYSRKNQRRTSVSVQSEGRLDDGHPSPGAHKDECHGEKYLQKSEQTNDARDIDSVLTPGRAGLLLSNTSKRKDNDAYDSFKYQKISPDVKFCMVGSPMASNKTQGSEAASLDCLAKTCSELPLGNGDFDVDRTTSLHDARGSTTRPLISSKKLTPRDLPFGQTALLEVAQIERTNENTHQTPSDMLEKQTMDRNGDTADTNMEKTASVNKCIDVAINQPQNVEIVNSDRMVENGKPYSSTEQDLPEETGTKSSGKSLKRKTVGKKTLGSRPKLNSTTNRKGPIYINKMASRNEASVGLSEENRGANEISSPNNDGRSLSFDNFVKQAEIVNDKKYETCTAHKYDSVNDETEAPEGRDGDWAEIALDDGKALDKDKSCNVESKCETDTDNGLNFKGGEQDPKIAVCISSSKFGEADFKGEARMGKTKVKVKPKVSKAIDNDESCNVESTCKTDKNVGLNFKGGEQDPKIAMSINTSKLGEAEFKEEVGKGKTKVKPKVNKVKKYASSEDDMKTPSLVGIKKSGQVKDAKEVQREINDKNMAEEEERALHPPGKANGSSKSHRMSKRSMDLGKENTPAADGGKSMTNDSRNADKTAADVSENTLKLATEMEFRGYPKNEPACFIFSGHRLQRKEYQQVIKRLKGKVCRDSHQWSYQATHFVVPDPIRRTEKFFAATASGRWILKTDYLTACSQAGKLLAEEPYEWHENCLTEDGAINLEAPRKWRLIREKTGHGAFCGMRIIVYGDCIAPPLDTLKRVVKAGDGTILATSPPYTRFLDSGVDYAIVSPGMPRVDMWVQEFLKHEIPCVVADYLVEYVCKPGYPVDRHVLYNTHAWAGKSFAKLQSRAEEIDKDMKQPENTEKNDLDCEVCGSSDRGEVMLICGDESGARGCGVGTHIDCCNPPLEKVPDEDWFCPKCTRSSMGKKLKKRRKESF